MAYGGTILNEKSCKDASHIFHSTNKIREVNSEWPKNAMHLHISWLIDSINKLKCQPFKKYIVSWESVSNDEKERRYNNIFKEKNS